MLSAEGLRLSRRPVQSASDWKARTRSWAPLYLHFPVGLLLAMTCQILIPGASRALCTRSSDTERERSLNTKCAGSRLL